MHRSIKVFDFFSGCGGTSCGLSQAGFDIAFGLDIDKDAASTFKLNFPDAYYINDDIKNIDQKIISSLVDDLRVDNNLILFCGCAPCQPFSKQNMKKNESDPRKELLNYFANIVNANKPDFILIENVPGMQKLSTNNNSPFSYLLDTLKNNKYHYTYDVLPALWFGVPQKRERLVLVASKHFEIDLPSKLCDGIKTPYSTVREWIGSLPSISAGEKHPEIPDHISAKLSELNKLRISLTPEGKGRETWPEHLLLDCHKGHIGHSDVYGRLHWDKPASGLTTRCISYSNGRFGHPEQNRAISVREAALLQTFPMEYKFHGSMLSKAKQIGNAVPPKMAECIGTHIKNSIFNHYR
nr:DNA cytosine methyltransferase [uncultured Tolumonas sp.]